CPYLAAGQKIRDRCDHFCAAGSAGANCQDQITERQPSAGSDDLAKLAIPFHMLAVSVQSRCDASCHCEYVVHARRKIIHSLCTLKLTVQRHFCSNLKHHFTSAPAWPGIKSTAKSAPCYVRKGGVINRRVKMPQSGKYRDCHKNAA